MASKLGFSNIYFGPRGHGKTLQAVADAYDAHKKGRTVISNIWLNFPHIRFTDTGTLCEIMEEIGEYCNEVVLPTEGPDAILKDYKIKRKKATKKRVKYFILWDEIGKHLNSRNWTRNFKENPLLLDMLTEPRKYGLTMVGITQSWKMIDAHFRFITTEWFLMQKRGWWIFERLVHTKYYVSDGEFDLEKSIKIDEFSQFTVWNKSLNTVKGLYWTGEIVGAGLYKGDIPHKFTRGDIYKKKDVTVAPLSPTNDALSSSE